MMQRLKKHPWLLVVACLVTFIAADVLFLCIAVQNMPAGVSP